MHDRVYMGRNYRIIFPIRGGHRSMWDIKALQLLTAIDLFQ